MRLAAFGILVALMGAGCALQAGDPGGDDDPTKPATTELRPAQALPVPVGTTVNPASSAAPPNPEPSPWNPKANVETYDDSAEDNPEPSPWVPHSSVPGGPGGPQSGPGAGGPGNGGAL
jgi:hypothetical protein